MPDYVDYVPMYLIAFLFLLVKKRPDFSPKTVLIPELLILF